MTAFIVTAAALLLASLAFLLPPLLRRRGSRTTDRNAQNVAIARERLEELERDRRDGRLDDAQFRQAKTELEQSLVADLDDTEQPHGTGRSGRWLAGLLVFVVPATAVALYWQIGTPAAFQAETAAPPVQQASGHASMNSDGSLPSVEEMIDRLAARLEQEPHDADGWYMLGRSYMTLGRYAEAADALGRLHQLVGDDPSVLVSYADALAMASDGRLSGKPQALILRALEKNPDHPTGLWLAGMSYAEQDQPRKALDYWYRAEPRMQDRPEALAELHGLIAHAEAQLGGDGGYRPAAAPQTVAEAAPATTGPGLHVKVTLAPQLAGRMSPDDTLFVFAQRLDGPPMPLAVARRTAGDLPLDVTLDDSMAMTPMARLSSADSVRVSARISKSGSAQPQPGDLLGKVSPVSTSGSGEIEILIDQVVR